MRPPAEKEIGHASPTKGLYPGTIDRQWTENIGRHGQDSCIYELEYVTPCFDDRDSNLSYLGEKTALPFRNATVRNTESKLVTRYA
jgi:hypothetical protein